MEFQEEKVEYSKARRNKGVVGWIHGQWTERKCKSYHGWGHIMKGFGCQTKKFRLKPASDKEPRKYF